MKISYGFNGYMYTIRQHIDSYKKIIDCNSPIDYAGTHDVASLSHDFVAAMMPIIH